MVPEEGTPVAATRNPQPGFRMYNRSFLLACAATATSLTGAMPAIAADPELTVLEWAGWGIPELMAPYKEKNGDTPTYSFFADDDEAFQKVSSGFRTDIAHPCAAHVGRYREAGLIVPWDVSKIPEFDNIAPRMMDSDLFRDAEGVWFIPSDYAYTGTAYNAAEVTPEDVASLQVYADPKYAGRISLPDSTDDVWSLAFLATGLTSWDDVTDEQFQAAADWLRSVHPNVRAYWADPSEMSQLMISGEVLVAWSWNDGVAALKQAGFPVGFQRTAAEGGTTWFCGYVKVKDGPGKEEKAYDFINTMLSPASAQVLIDNLGYALSNDAAMKTVPEDVLKDHFLDPISGPILAQTPLPGAFRNRMIEEFEAIKAGF